MASTLVPPQISYLVLIPFSLVTVRQPRTTTATKTAIRKGQPCRCRLGPRHPTYHLENAVDGAKCDGELTVMEQPEAPSSARPIELYRHPELQVLGCRHVDHRIHSPQSMLFQNRPITGIWAQNLVIPHVACTLSCCGAYPA